MVAVVVFGEGAVRVRVVTGGEHRSRDAIEQVRRQLVGAAGAIGDVACADERRSMPAPRAPHRGRHAISGSMKSDGDILYVLTDRGRLYALSVAE